MRERPILFSGAMVHSIRADRKTQTRRVAKPQPWCPVVGPRHPVKIDRHGIDRHGDEYEGRICPHGRQDDRLWVRETWAETDRYCGTPVVTYRAGGCIAVGRDGALGPDMLLPTYAWPDTPEPDRWRPSIFMPRWASRITLEIIDVRVERLQDISEADAVAEGVSRDAEGRWLDYENEAMGGYFDHPTHGARSSFQSLWHSINGRESWIANPWVWVIEFRRIDAAEQPT